MGASLFGSRRAYTKCISNARRRLPKQLWQLCAGTVDSSMTVDLSRMSLGHYGAEHRRDTVASFRIGRQRGDVSVWFIRSIWSVRFTR